MKYEKEEFREEAKWVSLAPNFFYLSFFFLK